jgi:hypothetical protein
MYCANDSLLTGNASAGSSNIKSDDAADTSFSPSSSYHPFIYRALSSNLAVIAVFLQASEAGH